MKKRICVLFTGGTIGSKKDQTSVKVDSTQNSLLIDLAKKEIKGVEYDCFSVLNMHSENVQESDLYKIVEFIKDIDVTAYDGVILTHGTDTLTYTANYLSLVLFVSIPVVLVSSAYPLSDERSNGLINFLSAVRFIENTNYKGVFVAYKNIGENPKIHLASRVMNTREFDGYVDSLAGQYFGEQKGKKFKPQNLPENFDLRENVFGGYKMCSDIMVVHSRSLLDYTYFDFENKKPKAVIVVTYHSGTVCTSGEKTNFSRFLEYAKQKGVEVIVAPIDENANVYESAVDLQKSCIISFNQSVSMTTVKVMLALGCDEDIQSVLDKNYAFEKVSSIY